MNEQVSISLADCRPLSNHILLLRLPDLGNDSALVIPQTAQKPSHRGKVLRYGPGKWFEDHSGRRPVDVRMDDVVHYQSCDVDDGTYVLIEEGDILFKENRD